MVQTVISDGGIVPEPLHYFREHESTYRYIGERLSATKQAYLDADRETRLRLLFDASSYALITANAPLEQADRGFRVYVDHYRENDGDVVETGLVDALSNASFGFYNMKGGYIADNYDRLDDLFADVDEMLISGNDDEAQARLMDASGLGPAKSAFTLSMLGWVDHACLDTNVCQYLDMDKRVYDRYDADEYKALVAEAFARLPTLSDEISPFLLQWLIFDLKRDKIEPHDMWFLHVQQVIS